MAQTPKQEIGKLGEDVSVKHLVKRSYAILDRNYRKKWGEIDIVAKKDGIIHFIEVKTIKVSKVSYETDETETAKDNHSPEENVHYRKRQRLARAIKTYLLEKKVSYETEWQVDVLAVFLDFNTRQAKIRITENVLL